MSLVNKPELTPERLAANRANAQLSGGPFTREGLERAREAAVRHGFYSKIAKEALEILGEDSEEFTALQDALRRTWDPQDGFETRLVERLARAFWRFQRGDRLQESLAVTQVKSMDVRSKRRARRQEAAYRKKRAGLNSLLEASSGAEFVTTQAEIDTLASACRGKTKGRASEVLVLLLRLAENHAPRPELPASDGLALRKGTELSVAEGPKRDELRGRLQTLLREEIEALEERRELQKEASLQATSPYYRDVMTVAAGDRRNVLMARMEEASLRQIERLTKLLITLQKKRTGSRR